MKPIFCLGLCIYSRVSTKILTFKQNSNRLLEHTYSFDAPIHEIKPIFSLEFRSYTRILTRILIFGQDSDRIPENTFSYRYIYIED